MKTVLLLSGGVDSTALLVTEDVDQCLFVDYGQPAAWQEHIHASALAEQFNKPYLKIQANLKLGAMGFNRANNPMVVPGRNAALIALAHNRFPGYRIVHGSIHEDDADYFDCRPQFFHAMSIALGVPVVAPHLERTATKQALVKQTNNLVTWSCYAPRAGKPCGACNSCKAAGGK